MRCLAAVAGLFICFAVLGASAFAADESGAPIPGVGYRYCWTMDATRPSMLEFANANPTIKTLPATNFKPATPFSDLIGTKFNGAWKIEVTDLWGIDNGFICPYLLTSPCGRQVPIDDNVGGLAGPLNVC